MKHCSTFFLVLKCCVTRQVDETSRLHLKPLNERNRLLSTVTFEVDSSRQWRTVTRVECDHENVGKGRST